MEDTGLHLSKDTITGMLDTESSAMESNGDAFLPEFPVLGQTADWSLDQVAPEPLTNILPEDSDASQDSEGQQQQPPHEMNSTELGSVEKAVEQFQIASAQLFQEEQPPQPTEEAEQPSEDKGQSANSEEPSQDMSVEPSATEQDGSQDGTEAPQVTEDGMELEEPSKEATEELTTEPTESELPNEFDKLFKGCEENPEDFNGWVYLLQYVEQENVLAAVQKAFDVFFLRYPYCYGYWKKYADIEKKHGNVQVAEEVYRRGLQAIPLSVDLWLHYLTYIKENSDPSDPDTEGHIRAAYEQSVLAAGTDFRSDRLWESFINWETEQQQLANVTAIYDRVLGIPTQLYSQHFQRFRDHVQNNNPKHFLSEKEFVELRLELSKASLLAMISNDGDTPAADEEIPPGVEDLTDPAKRVTEIENMRHKVIEVRQEVFNHNEHEVSKRWAFEEGIKRPYFHVKALEKTQLNNWKEYLDFEIENGTPERVVVLFERCLIACALYEEFWTKVMSPLTSPSLPLPPCTSPINDDNHIDTVNRPALSLRVTLICDCICCIRGWPACHTRIDCRICQLLRCIFFVSHYLTETYLIGSMKYAKYLESYSSECVRHVYKKACTIHLPKKPAFHLLWAAFEEQQGNVEEARDILKSLELAVPGLAMVRLRRVSLERRHGNLDEAEVLLREAMDSAVNVTETSFYAVKLARQLMKVQRSQSKARKVLLDAIEKDQTSPKLYLNLLELEYSGDVTQNEAEILACFDRALNSQMPLESRLLFSQRKVEFLEDFGSDINVLVAAYDEQQKLQKESEPTKRKAENGSQEPDAKRQRVDDSSAGDANAATDMQANNSAYNYNNWYQQYPGWGQNSWGQYNQYAQYNQYYPPPPT